MRERAAMRRSIKPISERPGPPWPGRGEKVAPNQEGGPARAPVPVLGAAYARKLTPVRANRLYSANEGARPGRAAGRVPDRVADRPRRDGCRLPLDPDPARARR